MGKFADIIGHEQIIHHLQSAISLNKVSHAYIFEGEEGMGKNMLASAFAQTLQCRERDTEACMRCPSCKQAATGNQPDIIRVTHEKASIGVEDIREKLCGDILIKPYSSPYKIYIVDEAEKMTVQAQNALLKTIEEPPSYGIILLLTTNSGNFLPTIISRCVTLKLKPLRDEDIRAYLMDKMQIPDYQAEICVAFARGNLGKACSLAASEDFSRIKEQALSIAKHVREMEVYEVISSVKAVSEFKLEIQDFLDILMVWYRDVLMFKATCQGDAIIFSDELEEISVDASRRSYEGLETIIKALEKAKVRLNANVNFDLTMELLFLTIKEN